MAASQSRSERLKQVHQKAKIAGLFAKDEDSPHNLSADNSDVQKYDERIARMKNLHMSAQVASMFATPDEEILQTSGNKGLFSIPDEDDSHTYTESGKFVDIGVGPEPEEKHLNSEQSPGWWMNNSNPSNNGYYKNSAPVQQNIPNMFVGTPVPMNYAFDRPMNDPHCMGNQMAGNYGVPTHYPVQPLNTSHRPLGFVRPPFANEPTMGIQELSMQSPTHNLYSTPYPSSHSNNFSYPKAFQKQATHSTNLLRMQMKTFPQQQIIYRPLMQDEGDYWTKQGIIPAQDSFSYGYLNPRSIGEFAMGMENLFRDIDKDVVQTKDQMGTKIERANLHFNAVESDSKYVFDDEHVPFRKSVPKSKIPMRSPRINERFSKYCRSEQTA